MPVKARFCPSCGEGVPAPIRAGSGEERRLVTVLFADVTGSTALGEQLDPERFREVLDAYFAAMREEIEAEGGTVEKFIGDAVMAAFGVPAAHEDDPARALRAALRMLRRLEDVNADLAPAHGVTLADPDRREHRRRARDDRSRPGEPMVTGDAVNAAARLEQLADPGTVVAGERTVRCGAGLPRPRSSGRSSSRARPTVIAFRVVEETGSASSGACPASPRRWWAGTAS